MEHIPKIVIRPIDAEHQRYPTCGDWMYDADANMIVILVSRMGDYRSELAVAIHEAFEAVQCLAADISEVEVTTFDLKFEAERDEGKHKDTDEPGDDNRAPYQRQHLGATWVEREVCSRSDLSWQQHEQNVNDA
jgi:hypothetical protein